MSNHSSRPCSTRRLALLACALASLAAVPAVPAVARTAATGAVVGRSDLAVVGSGTSGEHGSTDTPTPPVAVATLQQCVTSLVQSERSASFQGEMNAIPGTARMQMRIGVLEREPGEPQFHAVSAPGLDIWRGSAAGVKIYTYIKQVTNLSAPAVYRGVVRFRWLDAKGHVLKSEELHTTKCSQPLTPSTAGAVPAPPATGSSSTPSVAPSTTPTD